MFENLMRYVRIRSLKEGKMQTGRVEGLPNDVRDDAQRPQDYGFAGNPVDGQGVKLEIGGHTIIIRMDRLAERPQLAAYEVSVWHKEGHNVTLRAGKVIEANCDTFRINAAVKVEMNTPVVAMSANATVGGRLTAGGVTAAGKVLDGHTHNDPQGGVTGANN